MRLIGLHCLCLVALLSHDLVNCTIIDDDEPRRTFPTRRAIDGTRGRKYYDPEEENPYESYGSSNGRYDPYEEETDLSDIRNNVPGEPGVDYPAYTRLPQTEFVCEAEFRGYYADEGAGCQVFHVCDGNFVVSSFLCPIGSIFSQKLLTCDWWNKVDCSLTRNYHAVNSKSLVSEVDDDEILRKAFEMAQVQPAGERIPVETVSQQQQQQQQQHQHQQQHQQQQQQQRRHQDRRQHQRIVNYGGSVNEQDNDLPTGQEAYPDYSDYPTRLSSRYKSNIGNKQRYRQHDYYSGDITSGDDTREGDDAISSIGVHSRGESRKNEHRQGSFRNEFQPSYAPTVPTVATTARRFYSPTVPTTNRPPTTFTGSSDTFGRYDLLFEGSDHLYTAHGRADDTVKAATPSSFPTKDLLELPDAGASIRTPDVEDYDMIQGSASSPNINLPIEAMTDRNLTALESTNETVASLDHKERTIQEDLDRLTQKITETLSILTIDKANRDPTVFSYSQDDNQKNAEELPIVANSTITAPPINPKQDAEPADVLEPPSENQSPFRIMILDGNSTRSDGNTSDAAASSGPNLTKEAQPIKLPFSSDRKDQRESRIFRILVNNATGVNSPRDSEEPKIVIEKVKSIDKLPQDPRNFTGTRIISPIVDDEKSNMAVSINGSSLSWTPKSLDLIPTTTTIRSDHVTQEEVIVKSAEPINVIRQSTMADDSSVANQESQATTIAPSENNDSRRTIPQVIVPSKIDDAIELASSPVQFTLTVNKSDDIDPSGDTIRKLIAQREIGDSIGAADYKNFEIVRSDEPGSAAPADLQTPLHLKYNGADTFRTAATNYESRIADENTEIFPSNGLQSANYLRSIVALVNGPNSPRPFAQNVDIKTSLVRDDVVFVSTSTPLPRTTKKHFMMDSTRAPIHRSTETIVSTGGKSDVDKSLETLEALSSGLLRNLKVHRAVPERSAKALDDSERNKEEEKLIFTLPEARRFRNFDMGLQSGISELSNPRRIMEKHENSGTNETRGNDANVGTVVQTEFIPSLGFSLNTDEERETYMDAVVKGLLHDVRATETTNDANKTMTAES